MDLDVLQRKRTNLLRDQARLSDIVFKLKGQINELEEALELRQRDLNATNGALNVIAQLMREPESPLTKVVAEGPECEQQ